MARYRITVPVYMDAWGTVELSDTDGEGNPLTEEQLLDLAIEKANMPSLCHQCAGWNRPDGFEESGDPDWDKATIHKMEEGDRDYS